MCGRFVIAEPPDVYADYFGVDAVHTEALAPSYNVAPTDPVYAVAEHEGARRLGTFRWGLIPFWSKDRKAAARHINARVETAASKPAFKDSFERRRCLIPADGFYEWEVLGDDRPKLPHYIYRADRRPLAFAGLWASWRDPATDERVRTCTILTGRPAGVVTDLHDRMPVVLPEDAWAAWLDRDNRDVAELQAMVGSVAAPDLAEHAVSTLVNKVANNVPENVAPLPGKQVAELRAGGDDGRLDL